MHLKDVLNKCKEEGYPITAGGLYFSGKKYGFLVKEEGSRNLVFDKTKFYEWLNKAKCEAPKGWLTVKEISEKFNISVSQAYILIKDPDSGAKSFGPGPGVLYANIGKIKSVIRKRERNHQENWDE